MEPGWCGDVYKTIYLTSLRPFSSNRSTAALTVRVGAGMAVKQKKCFIEIQHDVLSLHCNILLGIMLLLHNCRPRIMIRTW